MTTAQLCTFTVGDLLFGVRVAQVQEVLRHQPMTRVPLAHGMVSGLINLRGQIVTAIDMRACLGLPPLSGEEQAMNVVTRGTVSNVSLLVDSIGDVIEVPTSSFEQCPTTLPARLRAIVDGVCKLPSQLLLLLAPERAIAGSGDHESLRTLAQQPGANL